MEKKNNNGTIAVIICIVVVLSLFGMCSPSGDKTGETVVSVAHIQTGHIKAVDMFVIAVIKNIIKKQKERCYYV